MKKLKTIATIAIAGAALCAAAPANAMGGMWWWAFHWADFE